MIERKGQYYPHFHHMINDDEKKKIKTAFTVYLAQLHLTFVFFAY